MDLLVPLVHEVAAKNAVNVSDSLLSLAFVNSGYTIGKNISVISNVDL